LMTKVIGDSVQRSETGKPFQRIAVLEMKFYLEVE